MQNNLGLFLTKRALMSPRHDAYVDSHSGLRLNYDELNRRCNQITVTTWLTQPRSRIA